MEKKKYHKPQINVIAIDAVGIMAVSTETTSNHKLSQAGLTIGIERIVR